MSRIFEYINSPKNNKNCDAISLARFTTLATASFDYPALVSYTARGGVEALMNTLTVLNGDE